MKHEDENGSYEYDEFFNGVCDVVRGSAVDEWSGYKIKGSICGEKATWVVQEWGEDPSYVCADCARVWVKNEDDGQVVFAEPLQNKPVSEDEVQAAIASIKSVVA